VAKKKRYCNSCKCLISDRRRKTYSLGKYCPVCRAKTKIDRKNRIVDWLNAKSKHNIWNATEKRFLTNREVLKIIGLGNPHADYYYMRYKRTLDRIKRQYGCVDRLRLTLYVKPTGKFYYDIGIRAYDDSLNVLSQWNNHMMFGEYHPRYFEDFIFEFGERNVTVYEGCMSEDYGRKPLTDEGKREIRAFKRLKKYRALPLEKFCEGTGEMHLQKYWISEIINIEAEAKKQWFDAEDFRDELRRSIEKAYDNEMGQNDW